MALLFILVWVIPASLLLDFWPLVRSEGEYATITNSEYGFSVDYPTKWVARIYGEYGFKGERDVKLRIYRSLAGSFEMSVYQRSAKNPTVDEVSAWGESRIQTMNESLSKQGDPELEELFLQNTTVRKTPIMRRRYFGKGIMNEDVYIARTDDMIIITLQAAEESFEDYLDEFNAIVTSFRPLD